MTQAQFDDSDGIEVHTDELPPSFDPRGAFAWTLRSAETARRERAGSAAAAAGSERH